jgi:NADH-quinone oxidoreductase subunit L
LSSDFHASLLPWLLLALAFPLVSFLACFVIRPRIAWLSPIISSLLMVAALVFCLVLFIARQGAAPHYLLYQWTWFDMGSSPVLFSLLLDNYSLVMLLAVVSISTLVHIYSAGYMVRDQSQGRFFSLLGLFTFAMMALVVSGNLLVLFCFWELVGVTSYLLIAHWRTSAPAARAATKAFMFNRIGDAGFIAGLMIIWQATGSFDIVAMSSSDVAWTSVAGICIFIGAVAKSAQLPLMTWLPDAMEGPTPVSALIHAATMVAAGVFIMVRLQFLFASAPLIVVAATGSVTALYAGWLAIKQTDLKRILAYSTISQLGLMMIAIGMQAFDGAFLHLVTHAFFKACLFLCAGALINSIENSKRQEGLDAQDVRNMGGLRYSFPSIFVCFIIAGASLAGVPLMSGFISKEAMLIGMLAGINHWSGWIFISAFIGASFLTVMYTYRMIKSIFFGPVNASRFHPVAAVMQVPALICAGLSLWFFYSYNPLGYTAWFQHLPQLLAAPKTPVTVGSIIGIVLSITIVILIYRRNAPLADYKGGLLDALYDRVFVRPIIRLGSATLLYVDNRLIDRLVHRLVYFQVGLAKIGGLLDRHVIDGAVTLTSRFVRGLGGVTRSMVKGQVQSYLFWALAGFVALIFWFLK